ncbi:MAG: threonine/serine dehydratase [Pseudomonadota bacterium]
MAVSTAFEHVDSNKALAQIGSLVRRTPVLESKTISTAADCELYFKCEHLQTTGSFKLRGASFAVARLDDDCAGVATHSSGNHGTALAAAARARGFAAHVVMPATAVQTKIDAVRRHGGKVHFCAPTQTAREQGLAELVAQGFVPIPPYDHDDIIAGQGTLALEFVQQIDDLDVIVAPVGGGGMLAGITLAVADRNVRVVGAEPAGADDAARSLAAGTRVSDHQPETIADGLRALIGQRNLAVLMQHNVAILTVSEQQIVQAMHTLWTEMKQVVEPSGAVALAAVLNHAEPFRGLKVGIVLSGGNLDVQPMFDYLEAL